MSHFTLLVILRANQAVLTVLCWLMTIWWRDHVTGSFVKICRSLLFLSIILNSPCTITYAIEISFLFIHQMWVIDDVKSRNGHHNIVVNYLSFITQRFVGKKLKGIVREVFIFCACSCLMNFCICLIITV